MHVTIRTDNVEILALNCSWQTSPPNTHFDTATGSSELLEEQGTLLHSSSTESEMGQVSLSAADYNPMKMEISRLKRVQQQLCNALTVLIGKCEQHI